MNEQETKTSSVGYIAVIIIAIIGIGIYMWPKAPSEEQAVTTPSPIASVSTEAVPTTQAPAPAAPLINQTPKNLMHTVTIETNKGTIIFETYDADAPKAAKNFIDLANKGFYNGVIFHRVIKGFMIQGGDPTGTGRGGPGYQFADELNPATDSYKTGYKRGVVAMANAGPNTNGSQFFIMHADYPLPNSYTIFGRVVKGIEVVDAIAASKVDGQDAPLEKIVMNKVTVADSK